MRDADVRIFLPVYEQGAERSWSDVAFDYITGLATTKLSLLCLALSPMAYTQEGSRWFVHRDFFFGTTLPRYVNVVIGVNPTQQFRPEALVPEAHYRREMKFEEVAQTNLKATDFTPMPELERLFTVGVPNVAIIGGGPRDLDAVERVALRNYDAVVVPSQEDLEIVSAQIPGHPSLFCISYTDPVALEKLMRSFLPTST